MEQVAKYCMDVPEMGSLLGISRAQAYNLANSEGFPAIRIGKRIVIPVDALKRWINEQANHDETKK